MYTIVFNYIYLSSLTILNTSLYFKILLFIIEHFFILFRFFSLKTGKIWKIWKNRSNINIIKSRLKKT
jgi:hypothetical protein